MQRSSMAHHLFTRRLWPRPSPAIRQLFFLFFLFLVAMAARAFGETVEISPAVDTFVTTVGLNSTYSNLEHLSTGRNGAGALYRSMLGFNLTGSVPDGAEVEQAVLALYQSATSPSKGPIRLHRCVEFWTGPGTTWNHQPGATAAPVAEATPTQAPGWKEIDVTETVRGWIAGKHPNFGLALRGDEQAPSERRFHSREAEANQPRLRITYGTSPPKHNRAIESVEVVRGSDGGQIIRVAWHGQAAEPYPVPARPVDFSCELQVKVNGQLLTTVLQLLYYTVDGGAGGGGGVGCQASYPNCGGDCFGLWGFDGGDGGGTCEKHSDPGVKECVCQSPSILKDILAIEELKNGDLLEVLLLPKPWVLCPPFCPDWLEPGFVDEYFTQDDRFTLVVEGANPRATDNRGLRSLDVTAGTSPGSHYVRATWYAQAVDAVQPQPQPPGPKDFSCELVLKVNGVVRGSALSQLHYFPAEGTGGGGGVGCDGSYPSCNGPCPGFWGFDGGDATGKCSRHADPAVEECVCQSPDLFEAILAVEDLRRGDLLELLVVPKPWLTCPPFCPPDPETWLVLESFTADDRIALSFEPATSPRLAVLRGDTNDDGQVNLSDASFTLNYLFSGGARPPCLKAADANDTGALDISDAIATLGWLFLGTPEPSRSFAACAVDTTPDELECHGSSACPACPDPAAEAIEFSIESRRSQFAGRVRITGVIRNLGSDFESSAGQQAVYLYEVPQGGAARLVARAPFEDLAAGATAQVVFERDWDSASPGDGEFPPSYRLSIAYDPDIFLDGNERNDDCRLENNSLERSGTGINDLFE